MLQIGWVTSISRQDGIVQHLSNSMSNYKEEGDEYLRVGVQNIN